MSVAKIWTRASSPLFVQVLPDEEGHGVDLFAGGAAGVPDAHRIVGSPVLEQAGDDFPADDLERLGIAEEARHADKDVLGQGVGLFLARFEQGEVLLRSLPHRSPPCAARCGGRRCSSCRS